MILTSVDIFKTFGVSVLLASLCVIPGEAFAQTKTTLLAAPQVNQIEGSPREVSVSQLPATTNAVEAGMQVTAETELVFEPVGGGIADFTNASSKGAPCNAPSGQTCSLSDQCRSACGSIAGCGCHYLPPAWFELYGDCGCGVYIPKK